MKTQNLIHSLLFIFFFMPKIVFSQGAPATPCDCVDGNGPVSHEFIFGNLSDNCSGTGCEDCCIFVQLVLTSTNCDLSGTLSGKKPQITWVFTLDGIPQSPIVIDDVNIITYCIPQGNNGSLGVSATVLYKNVNSQIYDCEYEETFETTLSEEVNVDCLSECCEAVISTSCGEIDGLGAYWSIDLCVVKGDEDCILAPFSDYKFNHVSTSTYGDFQNVLGVNPTTGCTKAFVRPNFFPLNEPPYSGQDIEVCFELERTTLGSECILMFDNDINSWQDNALCITLNGDDLTCDDCCEIINLDVCKFINEEAALVWTIEVCTDDEECPYSETTPDQIFVHIPSGANVKVINPLSNPLVGCEYIQIEALPAYAGEDVDITIQLNSSFPPDIFNCNKYRIITISDETSDCVCCLDLDEITYCLGGTPLSPTYEFELCFGSSTCDELTTYEIVEITGIPNFNILSIPTIADPCVKIEMPIIPINPYPSGNACVTIKANMANGFVCTRTKCHSYGAVPPPCGQMLRDNNDNKYSKNYKYLNIYPNPIIKNEVGIQLPYKFNDDVLEISVLDFSGKLVQSFKNIVPDIDSKVVIKFDKNIKSGVYLISVSNGLIEEATQFIVQ